MVLYFLLEETGTNRNIDHSQVTSQKSKLESKQYILKKTNYLYAKILQRGRFIHIIDP
jgi:hypothetical protein